MYLNPVCGNIYNAVKRKQHFGMIQNAFIRVVDNSNAVELLRFNLSYDFSGKTALYVGEIYRHNNEWKFAATGEGTNDAALSDMVRNFK